MRGCQRAHGCARQPAGDSLACMCARRTGRGAERPLGTERETEIGGEPPGGGVKCRMALTGARGEIWGHSHAPQRVSVSVSEDQRCKERKDKLDCDV